MLMRDVAERVDALRQTLFPFCSERGNHAHHNMSLESRIPRCGGMRWNRVDASLAGMGAGKATRRWKLVRRPAATGDLPGRQQRCVHALYWMLPYRASSAAGCRIARCAGR